MTESENCYSSNRPYEEHYKVGELYQFDDPHVVFNNKSKVWHTRVLQLETSNFVDVACHLPCLYIRKARADGANYDIFIGTDKAGLSVEFAVPNHAVALLYSCEPGAPT